MTRGAQSWPLRLNGRWSAAEATDAAATIHSDHRCPASSGRGARGGQGAWELDRLGRGRLVVALAVLFPGQGAQRPGMAAAWADEPAASSCFAQASRVLGYDVVAVAEDPAAMQRTELVQPVVLAVTVAAWRELERRGVRPTVVAGHSLGEFAALVAAGSLEFGAALQGVRRRGLAMARAAARQRGAMTALVGLAPAAAEQVRVLAARSDVLVMANLNAPEQVVLSGSLPAVERAEREAQRRGAMAVRLAVAGAFHSPLMAPAEEAVRQLVDRLPLARARCPVVNNVTAAAAFEPSALRRALAAHVVSPVRWEASMRTLARLGVTTVVETGPGDALSKLARRCVSGLRAVALQGPEDLGRIVELAGDGLRARTGSSGA
jgi:[acyl-carrier-protein] S-malonyltransferase